MTVLLVFLGTAVAIAGLVGLNMWLGGWTDARVDSIEAALSRMKDDYLDFIPGEAILASNQKSALILENGEHRVGLIVAQGDILVPRLLSPSDVKSLQLLGSRLKVRMNDFTFPEANVEFASDEEARTWCNRLSAWKGDADA